MGQIVVRLRVLCCVSCRGSAGRLGGSCEGVFLFWGFGTFDRDRCVRGLLSHEAPLSQLRSLSAPSCLSRSHPLLLLPPPNAHIISLSSIFLLLFYLVLKCSLISFPSFSLDSQPLSFPSVLFPSVLFLFSWRAEDPSTHTHCAAVTTLPASTFSFCYLHFY